MRSCEGFEFCSCERCHFDVLEGRQVVGLKRRAKHVIDSSQIAMEGRTRICRYKFDVRSLGPGTNEGLSYIVPAAYGGRIR